MFRTSDIVAIATGRYVEIVDRAKDLVKSGGKWISTPTLEGALMAHPAVAEAAARLPPGPALLGGAFRPCHAENKPEAQSCRGQDVRPLTRTGCHRAP